MEEEERKEEELYLSDCIKELDRRIAKSETWLERTASGSRSDWDTEKEIRRIREEELEIAREAKPSPYFGRIDFQEEGQTSINRYYFGKHSILNKKSSLIV